MYRIGIDLGGTNIAAGVVDEGQHIVAEVSLPTGAERPAEAVVADICRAAEKAMEKAGITAAHCASVGIGSPGTCDSANGVVVRAYNLGWFNVPVCSMVTARLGLPCRLSNDANCAALAETVAGAAVGCRNMVLVTLGTGVGGGIIANGQLVRGVHFTAGEYSFVNTNAEAWDAPDQNMACQCSTSNLLKWYRARKALPEDAPLDGRSFFAAANAGEPEALEVLRRFCHAVAVQIYNLTVLLDVEKVAIGGGISKQPLLLESLRSAYDGLYASRAGQAYMEGLPRCQIVPCAFSSEANQVGVAAAYFEAMQKK